MKCVKRDVLWLLLLWPLVFSVSNLCSVCVRHPGLLLETREHPAAHIQPGDEHESTPDGEVWRGCAGTGGLSRTGQERCHSVQEFVFGHLSKEMNITSWKSCDISHTKQELLCISHLCRSDRKKSRSKGVCVSAWTIQFIKHVLPRFIRPRSPDRRHRKTVKHLTNHCFDVHNILEAMLALWFWGKLLDLGNRRWGE